MRILVVEDERIILENIVKQLEANGFAIDAATTGEVALELATINNYDVILLDVNLPDITGYIVCQSLRLQQIETPIIMVTARSEVADRVEGLDYGADDYLIKPFAFSELLARIRAMIRRNTGKKTADLQVGDISMSPALYQVKMNAAEVKLTKKEYEILYCLLLTHPAPQSLEKLIEHVWNDSVNPFSNAARVHIANLRKKVKQHSASVTIELKKEMGYYLCDKH